MLSGLMMDYPLTLTHFLERARTFFPNRGVVSLLEGGARHRYSYEDLYARAMQLARALERLGVKPGDRVGTLCWNHYRHLELYCAVPSMGAVLHTLNLRLQPSELGYIANHAGDRIIVVDRSLLPLLGQFQKEVRSLEQVIVIEEGTPAPGTLDYETLLSREEPSFVFPPLDENAAALMCYTSGTTGRPKGVLYSHRSTVLHTFALLMADTKAVSQRDTLLPLVPMFHANVWGLPFAALATGAKLVFAGSHLVPGTILSLIEDERVTLSAGVPTIWLGVLAELDAHPERWNTESLRLVAIGGSAAPPALIQGLYHRHGIRVMHAWGMTETNPLATVSWPKHDMSLDASLELACRASQGYAVPFVEQRHVDDEGRVLAWDGRSMGELEVRGPWVAASYYDDDSSRDRFTAEGWFKTGDVVTIDPEGYIRITDRSKDVIKSGGEWISSQEIENALMSHPAVLEAAVFAAEHSKWGERPLAAVVFKAGHSATKEELAAHLVPGIAKWWLPDDYLFMKEIPRTSTGKFKKTALRESYGKYLVSQASMSSISEVSE